MEDELQQAAAVAQVNEYETAVVASAVHPAGHAQLGGDPTPGVGFAAGLERMVLASSEEADAAPTDVFVALDGGDPRDAFVLTQRLRAAGLSAQMEQAGRSLKGQLKQAGRVDARAVAILGADGIRIRSGGSEQEVAGVDAALEALR